MLSYMYICPPSVNLIVGHQMVVNSRFYHSLKMNSGKPQLNAITMCIINIPRFECAQCVCFLDLYRFHFVHLSWVVLVRIFSG